MLGNVVRSCVKSNRMWVVITFLLYTQLWRIMFSEILKLIVKIAKNINSRITIIGIKETFKIDEVNVKNPKLEFEIWKKFWDEDTVQSTFAQFILISKDVYNLLLRVSYFLLYLISRRCFFYLVGKTTMNEVLKGANEWGIANE